MRKKFTFETKVVKSINIQNCDVSPLDVPDILYVWC